MNMFFMLSSNFELPLKVCLAFLVHFIHIHAESTIKKGGVYMNYSYFLFLKMMSNSMPKPPLHTA